jgi:hypothetical protein
VDTKNKQQATLMPILIGLSVLLLIILIVLIVLLSQNRHDLVEYYWLECTKLTLV